MCVHSWYLTIGDRFHTIANRLYLMKALSNEHHKKRTDKSLIELVGLIYTTSFQLYDTESS